MQLLCTLRDHCRQWPRNTRYQAGRYPLLGPDFHRLDRTSFWLAHSFDHLVGEHEHLIGGTEAERLCGFEVNDQLELGWLDDRQVCWLFAFEDAPGIAADLAPRFGLAGSIADQSP